MIDFHLMNDRGLV